MLKEPLNKESLLETLIGLPVMALAAKTNDVKEVMERLNVEGESTKEIQFLKDLFTLNTNELINKWYNEEAVISKIPEELR